MIHRLLQVSFAGLLAALPYQATAVPCNEYTVDVRQSAGAVYDPSSTAGVLIDISIVSTDGNLANGCTSVPITISPQGGGQFSFALGADTLNYSVQNSNLVGARSASEISLNGNARNSLTSGQSVDVSLFSIQAGQFVRAGRYVAPITVAVGDAPPLTYELVIEVEPSIRFVAENGAREKNISFGEVTGGATRSSAIFYRTNAALQIRATSENNGVLVHQSGVGYGSIPYSAVYNSSALNLSSGPSVVNRTYTGSGMQSDLLSIDIAPQNNKFAGKYRDVLTLEFIPY